MQSSVSQFTEDFDLSFSRAGEGEGSGASEDGHRPPRRTLDTLSHEELQTLARRLRTSLKALQKEHRESERERATLRAFVSAALPSPPRSDGEGFGTAGETDVSSRRSEDEAEEITPEALRERWRYHMETVSQLQERGSSNEGDRPAQVR